MFAAEVAVLVAASVLDAVLALGDGRPTGIGATLLVSVVPYAGTAMAILAVLRRRFPHRIGWLGAAVVGLSVLDTGASAVAELVGIGQLSQPVVAEVLAVVLLVGAGVRRLPRGRAVTLALLAGAAVVAAPVVRFGVGSPAALLAAPAALLWGVALAVGLVLRDADSRHRAELRRVRTGERLQLARELHDLVTHYISGIVVRAQAARSLHGNPAAPEQDPAEVYGEIERAGADALAAMRTLVGMLRRDENILPPPGSGLGDVVRAAAAGRAAVRVAEELETLRVPPELAATVHRVVLESVTNAVRHGPQETKVRVEVRVEQDDLVLDVSNDTGRSAGPASPPGYGITGMTERVTALGGTLAAGPNSGGRWHTTARLPLGPENAPFQNLPRGV
ncbi:hypothetical protein BU204_08610 [Actinophytocola xanthii]|uniref:histidine kinase n=1 Tax=Actinophytocola xanthii TaxID=1912961 RepID=A0A1Q8CUE8_9PSEU|nr:hypothetical protein BU204_08610 [Actinophytocola xanthii]